MSHAHRTEVGLSRARASPSRPRGKPPSELLARLGMGCKVLNLIADITGVAGLGVCPHCLKDHSHEILTLRCSFWHAQTFHSGCSGPADPPGGSYHAARILGVLPVPCLERESKGAPAVEFPEHITRDIISDAEALPRDCRSLAKYRVSGVLNQNILSHFQR